MIIDNTNISTKMSKKILPKKLEVEVTFLSFVITENEAGLVLYKSEDKFSPFSKTTIISKDLKLKGVKIFGDLISKTYPYFNDNSKYVDEAKKGFYSEFETNIEIKILKEFFELKNDEELTLKKHIICTISSIDSLENTFDLTSKIVPFSLISQFLVENNVPKYLHYYFSHQ